MKNIPMAIPMLALALMGTAGTGFAQQGYPPQQAPQTYPQQQQQPYPQQRQQQGPPPQGAPGYGDGYGDRERGGWDAPPNEFRDFARRGFRDGMEGARRDLENHRRPNPNNRDEYRHPSVPREVRRDYRMGFTRGYNMAMQHAFNGPQQQRPY